MTPDDSSEISHVDETCDRCGTRLLRIEPEDTSGSPYDVAYICEQCGVAVRYETGDDDDAANEVSRDR